MFTVKKDFYRLVHDFKPIRLIRPKLLQAQYRSGNVFHTRTIGLRRAGPRPSGPARHGHLSL